MSSSMKKRIVISEASSIVHFCVYLIVFGVYWAFEVFGFERFFLEREFVYQRMLQEYVTSIGRVGQYPSSINLQTN